MDHVIALSRGGNNTFVNVVCACKSCNSAKHDRPVLLFMLQNCERYSNRKLMKKLAI
ncbi:HNH endonuclease [Rossellomorea marisflavi]|uniref:HNH endonuclease n=1 Tax=Rossellomorea marisflavi TaxID=189381 RepID=UPI0009A81FC8